MPFVTAPDPAPGEDAPVTRAEFERLIAVVYDIADALADHDHGGIDDGSTYGGSTSSPNDSACEALRQARVRLNALRDREPEPKEDDDE